MESVEKYPPCNTEKKSRSCFGTGCLIVLLIFFTIAFLFFSFIFLCMLIGDSDSSSSLEESSIPCENSHLFQTDKLAVIEINGVIVGKDSEYSSACSSGFVIRALEKAMNDSNVKAVILSLNTPGGEVTAADDIYLTIKRLRKKTGKPVIALMNSMAASGGFYVAMACDKVMASRMTMTGSIGVIISTYNAAELLQTLGIQSEVYKSGEMKDMLNPARVRTEEEKVIVQRMVNETYEIFLQIVAEGRRKKVSELRGSKLTDGRVLSGKEALENGLIDAIGRFGEAKSLSEKLAHVPQGSLKPVLYKKPFSFSQLLMDSRSNRLPLNVNISGITPPSATVPLQRGVLYFLPAGY